MSGVCHQRARWLFTQVCKESHQLPLQTLSFYFPSFYFLLFLQQKETDWQILAFLFLEDLGIYSAVISKERSKFPQPLVQEENRRMNPLVVLEFCRYCKSYSCEVSSFQHLVFWMLDAEKFYFEIKQILIFSL